VTYYVGLPFVILAALIEASVLPLFRVAGLQPNLVLVILVAWLMVRGSAEAFVLIPIGGFVLGLTGSAPMGTALIALAPIALLHDLHMTVIFHFVYLLAYTVTGQSGDWTGAFLRVTVPVCLLNVLVLLPTYLVVLGLNQSERRPGYV
jgi:hypothetical protein